jgi:hypothetical protein
MATKNQLKAKLKKTKLHGLSQQGNYTDERLPLVGEVSANFCEQRGVAWSA